jgi:putative holliday junction resolvase
VETDGGRPRRAAEQHEKGSTDATGGLGPLSERLRLRGRQHYSNRVPDDVAWYARRVRTLGVDFGRKRIGLALSDPTGLIARPWKTLTGRGGVRQAAALLAREVEGLMAESDGLGLIVVGLPRRLSGEPNEQTAAVQSLVEHLRPMVTQLVVLQDERLSSREAEAHLARTHRNWRTRKPLVDAMAAAVILQDYLDEQPAARRRFADQGIGSPEDVHGMGERMADRDETPR